MKISQEGEISKLPNPALPYNSQFTVSEEKFVLAAALVEEYRLQRPPFGFNGLGQVVYLRTSAREKDYGHSEVRVETVERVVKGGVKNIQLRLAGQSGCKRS